MTQFTNRYFYLTFIVGWILFSCQNKPAEIVMTDYLISHHYTFNGDSEKIRQILDTILEKTHWRGMIQINRNYDPLLVNIYIIDGSAFRIKSDDQINSLISNCSFVGYNIIFLDDAYLRSFLPSHHVTPDPHIVELKDDPQCFLYWVIGHELGHLVCGHSQKHFDTGGLDQFVKNSTLENKEELEADSFFVNRIVANWQLRQSEERLMLNILNAEIEQKIGKIQTAGVGIIYDYTNEHVVHYARQPTHPEYVVRLSRMLELSSREGGDSGLYNLVGGFIRQLKEEKN